MPAEQGILTQERGKWVVLHTACPEATEPTLAEQATCLAFTRRHIELAKPKVVVLTGGTAAKAVLKPFFDQYLKDGAKKADTPPVLIYNTGENHWDRLKHWPLACDR